MKSRKRWRERTTNFFFFQTVKTRNELPKEIVNATSIDLFKNKLHEAWKYFPLMFCV